MTTQPGKQDDLDGDAPDSSPVALLLIDVITDFDFPRGEELYNCASPIASRVAKLKERAGAAGVPVIYVNDNFGRWRSNMHQLIETSVAEGSRGRSFVKQLAPGTHDYFVLKPKHSGFYQTPLEILLKHLGAERLILTGLSTNSCVLFTANDAYMRDLQLVVPPDCVAACSAKEHESALEEMKIMMKAELTLSTAIEF